ncbi:MAG: transcriptional repressor NrdR [Candidatus Marinimicrobia bacterium]|nr:transcriptional repressor NrdR [Candidatus Neomarinimicrobiota bacterium]
MKCVYCDSPNTRVVDSRMVASENAIRRRRECESCAKRFTTYEYIENTPVMVVKNDGRRESYVRQKVEKAIQIACNKRPVSLEQISDIVNDVELELSSLGRREVPVKIIGETVMKKLKALDEIAFIRFASVYRQYKDTQEFIQEIHRMN